MNRIHTRLRRRLKLTAVTSALLAASAALALAAGASASTSQVAVIQDGQALNQNPIADVNQMRALGANTLRVLLFWYQVAPNANSKSAPKHFSASNPNAYPAANWAQWDAIVKAASAAGMTVDLDITGAPPDWAQGKGVPSKFNKLHFGWAPNAADYGQFVQAVATRYDGHFTPSGASSALPKVSLYSLWNEPNFGQNLGPQAIDATSKSFGYLVAPQYYRDLVRTGWSALKKDASGARILVGEFAGQGAEGPANGHHKQGLPGLTAIASPVPFIQTLYCLNSKYQRLTGKAASVAGCPANAGQAKSFVKDNPGLFDATAISMHPYASMFKPDAKSSSILSGSIILPVIGRLTSELGHVTGAWHHSRSYDVWSTEYGYITSPPQKQHGLPSPATAATYLNQAEYLSYKNPRVSSYAQYLIADPPVIKGSGLFSSGLEYSNGKPKPGFDAYRMPLWLPSMSPRSGQSVEVWGGARPASFGYSVGHQAQRVQIQQQSGGSWTTLDTVTVSHSTGYFDTHLKFARSGSVRLAYTYPQNEPLLPIGDAGTTVYSRTVAVKVK